jgi:DNA-binding GntR family transcriptional regulator
MSGRPLVAEPTVATPATVSPSAVAPRPASIAPRAKAARRAEGMRVYRALRDAINDGRLAPDTRLIEDQLAVQFRVSRTPIRDAIQRLQQEGYVVTPEGFRHARPVVAPLVESDADELCSLVALHEGHAAAAAARLPTERRLELVAELLALNEAMRREGATPTPSRDRLRDIDAAFHHACTHAAAGPRLLALLDVIKPQAERYNRVYAEQILPKRIVEAAAEHDAIVRALRAGDSEAARRAVETNYGHGTAELTHAIDAPASREAPALASRAAPLTLAKKRSSVR